MRSEQAVPAAVIQTESLVKSLKGVRDARVLADGNGRILRIDIVAAQQDERAVTRNVLSALFAVQGVTLGVGVLHFRRAIEHKDEAVLPEVTAPPARLAEPEPQVGAQVLEISGAARKADLNVAARAAFDTLRAAQSSFHGFVFDGAELVNIAGTQYVVVAVNRATTAARYCGAAPVIDSVSTASARALMNAVGVAAMASPAFDFAADADAPREIKKA
jgi:hypothetical protein